MCQMEHTPLIDVVAFVKMAAFRKLAWKREGYLHLIIIMICYQTVQFASINVMRFNALCNPNEYLCKIIIIATNSGFCIIAHRSDSE